jgi:hypothetical protein
MSGKPMVRSQRPLKPATVDRLHKQAHDAVSRPRSVDNGQYTKLDQPHQKPLPLDKISKLDNLGLKK